MNESHRRRVRRIRVLTLLVGCLAFVPAACGGGGGSSPTTPTAPAPGTTPTAGPTATPTPTPASTVTLSVPTLAFNAVAQTGSFTATSSTGSVLAATLDQPAVATVIPGTAAGQFTVTAVGAGTCTITVTDAKGGVAKLVVTVTTFPVTVN
jgi:hypothetical protein